MTVPTALLEALESGTITDEQLRELITIEARELNLSFEDAVRLAASGGLPSGPIGTDIELLADLLAA